MDPLIDIDRKSYICITPDQRVRLFSLSTGQEKKVYMEKDHLSHSYTCCAWSPAVAPASSSQNSASSSSKNSSKDKLKEKEQDFILGVASQAGRDSSLGYFAVGTSSGSIIIWDLERGVVRKTITLAQEVGEDGSSPKTINDITFSADAKSIYVATKSATVQKIDWVTGNVEGTIKAGKKTITKIDRNPKLADTVLCLSTALRVANFISEDEKRKIELADMQVDVLQSKFSSCGRFIACCGRTGRDRSSSSSSRKSSSGNSISNSNISSANSLFIYDLEQNSSSPCATVPLDEAPTSVAFRSFSSKASPNYTLLSVFLAMPNGSSCIVKLGHEKTESASPTAQIDPQILKFPEAANVLCAAFGTATNPKLHSSITIATGGISKPLFHEVDLNSSGVDSSNSNSSNSRSSNNSAITYLTIPGISSKPKRDIGSTSSSGEGAEDGNGDSKRTKVIVGVDGGDVGGGMLDVKVDIDENAQTLGQLLNLLSAPSNNEGAAESSLSKGKASVGQGLVAPTSDSLVTLIVQALQSGDNSLLEQCLSCEDMLVIEESSRRLPAAKVTLFLKRLISKFEKRPSRGILLTKWLSSILRYHTGYLISIPDLSRQLGGLSQIMEQRLSTHHKLSSLGSRLDMLLSNSAFGSDKSSLLSDTASSNSVIPLKVYVEE